ncbi:hypothetical protein OC842_007531, partial [Tilletia horrida]
MSSTIGASVTVGGVTVTVSTFISAPVSGTVDASGALTGISASPQAPFDFGWTLLSGATDTFPTTDSGLAFSCLRVVLSGIGGMKSVLPTSASVPFVSATATIPAASSLLPAVTSGLDTGLVGAVDTLDSTIGVSALFPFVTAFVSVPLDSTGLPAVPSILPSTGLPGMTDILASTKLGSIYIGGITGVPTSGRSSVGALPSDSGLLSARPLPPHVSRCCDAADPGGHSVLHIDVSALIPHLSLLRVVARPYAVRMRMGSATDCAPRPAPTPPRQRIQQARKQSSNSPQQRLSRRQPAHALLPRRCSHWHPCSRRRNPCSAGLNGNGAGRARGRQITHYGAGDVDYSPSPSPPISPGLGPAFGGLNGGGAGAGRAGYLVEPGVRRAGKQRAYDNGLADSDVLTNPLLMPALGAETGQRRLSWTRTLLRPTRDQVERWLDSWLKRWSVLAIIPALVVWIWCAVPFPHSDPDSVGAPWGDPKTSAWTIANHSQPSPPHLPTTPSPAPAAAVDANFVFFLLFYYGIYVAVALIYVTQLFSLYRLNWCARSSYTFFWASTLVVGWAIHRWDPFGTEERDPKHRGEGDDIQWQRKTLWVMLAFVAMAVPAVVCLTGLRRSGRQAYRHSLTDMQKTFLERQVTMRIPSSYIRFRWFIASISLALLALLAGQGYASVYLSTLPHTSLEGTAYVTFWMTTVNSMALASHWILEEKVRSRALVFVFKYFYFLVYFIFYRNLFARLRSFDQFALIQLLSSFWVCIWYPFRMSGFCHRVVQYFNPEPKSWEEYVESVGLAFYLRNLAQDATMLAFLGWVSILHFGNNPQLYLFFASADKNDPYNYQLTML